MDFKNKLILAPMAGFTDHPMRHLAVRYGADMVVSEMISAKAMHFKDKKTATLARIFEGEGTFGAQIFGSEPEIMAEAARSLSFGEYEYKISDTLPDFIDINMGCPVKKIVSNGEGSALLKNPNTSVDKLLDIIKAPDFPGGGMIIYDRETMKQNDGKRGIPFLPGVRC